MSLMQMQAIVQASATPPRALMSARLFDADFVFCTIFFLWFLAHKFGFQYARHITKIVFIFGSPVLDLGSLWLSEYTIRERLLFSWFFSFYGDAVQNTKHRNKNQHIR